MKNIFWITCLVFLLSGCGILGGFTGTYVDKDKKPVLVLHINGTGTDSNGTMHWESLDSEHIVLIYPDGKKVRCFFLDKGILGTMGSRDGIPFAILIGYKL